MISSKRFKQIHVLLLVLSVALICLAVINFFTFNRTLDSSDRTASSFEVDLPSTETFQLNDLMSYKQLFASKRLFRPLIKKTTKKAKVVTIDDLARDYVLGGVVTQGEPEAIVKNRRTRQSYFVKKGASLGEMKVESVGEDQIVLSYKDEKKTLFIQ